MAGWFQGVHFGRCGGGRVWVGVVRAVFSHPSQILFLCGFVCVSVKLSINHFQWHVFCLCFTERQEERVTPAISTLGCLSIRSEAEASVAISQPICRT